VQNVALLSKRNNILDVKTILRIAYDGSLISAHSI